MRINMQTKKLEWLVTVATAIGAPLALLFASCAKEIAEAVDRLGDGTILAIAAATNALTVIP